MSRVYSARFINLLNFAGTYTYDNETGDLLIVRQISVYFGGDTQPTCGLNGPDDVAWFAASLGPLTQAYIAQEGRWVLNDGESMTFATGGGAMDIYVGGYALSLP